MESKKVRGDRGVPSKEEGIRWWREEEKRGGGVGKGFEVENNDGKKRRWRVRRKEEVEGRRRRKGQKDETAVEGLLLTLRVMCIAGDVTSPNT